jgi:hypothetical protein
MKPGSSIERMVDGACVGHGGRLRAKRAAEAVAKQA